MHIARNSSPAAGYILQTSATVPTPQVEVFEFFADALNLNSLTPPWLHFEILTPAPIEMRAGAIIDYRLRLHGFPIEWKTEIVAWEPPCRFVDLQREGPYRRWRHEHTFTTTDGGTQLTDKVDYEVPGGWPVHELLVRRNLSHIFMFRHRKLLEIFNSSA